MLLFRITLAALLFSAVPSSGSIDNMEQVYFAEDAFTRISEFFTGKEDRGNRSILRSHPDARAGHYVKFNLAKPYAVDHCRLEVLALGVKEIVTYAFKVEESWTVEKAIYLGLTGPEWSQKSQPPIAYKVVLLDAAGNTIASARSFSLGRWIASGPIGNPCQTGNPISYLYRKRSMGGRPFAGAGWESAPLLESSGTA